MCKQKDAALSKMDRLIESIDRLSRLLESQLEAERKRIVEGGSVA